MSLTLHYSNILKYFKHLTFGWPVTSWYMIIAKAIPEATFTMSYISMVGRKASSGINCWKITHEWKVIIIGYSSPHWLWDDLDRNILSYCYKHEKDVVRDKQTKDRQADRYNFYFRFLPIPLLLALWEK